jgi:RNA polymerase sigma-70 factor (ECF subfamily)
MAEAGQTDLRTAFRQLAGGGVGGLETVWGELAHPLHNYAFALTGDQDEADDILSETLAKLPRIGWRLRWVRNPKAYLFASVRNAARSRARRARLGSAEEAGQEPASPDGSEAALIRAAVLDLPEEQRETVVLHIWGGLTFEEIGGTTGVSANTAASRYRYALQKLRPALREGDDER